jgi:hypothetical protein
MASNAEAMAEYDKSLLMELSLITLFQAARIVPPEHHRGRALAR